MLEAVEYSGLLARETTNGVSGDLWVVATGDHAELDDEAKWHACCGSKLSMHSLSKVTLVRSPRPLSVSELPTLDLLHQHAQEKSRGDDHLVLVSWGSAHPLPPTWVHPPLRPPPSHTRLNTTPPPRQLPPVHAHERRRSNGRGRACWANVLATVHAPLRGRSTLPLP